MTKLTLIYGFNAVYKKTRTAKKIAAPKKLNLGPAFKLIDGVEKLADKNKPLLKKLTALRKYLQELAGK